MIISHKHKFILIRPRKVAGTSILYNLGKWCGDDDIVNTPSNAILRSNILKKTNLEFASNNIVGNGQIHIVPALIRERYPVEWKKYSRIGCIRNPYDIAYSMYCMVLKEKLFLSPKDRMSIGNTRDFNEWVKSIYKEHKIVNPINIYRGNYVVSSDSESYWFYDDTNEEVKYDFMIRYENLEDDYKTVCNHFDIPHEPLVKLNTETRLDVESDRTYQRHYNDESREIIGEIWSKVIKRYDYVF